MEAEKVKKKVKLKRTAAENGEASLGAVKSVKKEKKDRKRVKDSEDISEERKHKRSRIDPEPMLDSDVTKMDNIPGSDVHTQAADIQENGTVDENATATQNRGKKRRRRTGENLDNLPPDERRRREEQRALRMQALEMRAEGKVYKRPKKRQATETSKSAIANPSAKMQNQPKYAADEEGSKPEGSVQVIVVPIFWNRKPEEKASVIEASGKIVRLLQDAGLTSGMDTTTSLSPGQKFAYWEKMGVKVRVECGPRDAAQGSCVLAITKKPGELAEKQTCKTGAMLVKKAGQILGVHVKALPISIDSEIEEKDRDLPPPPKRPASALVSSGDDLGGDFGEINLLDEQPKKRKKSK